MTFAVFVIKNTFKYNIFKKKFQIIKENIMKLRLTFIIFETFIYFVKLKFRSNFVKTAQIKIILQSFLNFVSIFIAIFYRFNN